MIKNDRQFKITKQRLNELKKGLERIHKKYSADKNKVALLSQGYVEHIAQLEAEIGEYEKRKDEVTDLGTLAMVREGRRAIQAGSKGIPVAQLFNKIRRRSEKTYRT